MSQFKDEETIENALRGCHENVRLMKSSAVLMEVLGLLKNEEYAKDALSALANFLNNNLVFVSEVRRYTTFLDILTNQNTI